MAEAQVYTLAEVATLLGYDKRTIYRKLNEIPGAFRISITGHIRFKKDVFDEWLACKISNPNFNNNSIPNQDKK